MASEWETVCGKFQSRRRLWGKEESEDEELPLETTSGYWDPGTPQRLSECGGGEEMVFDASFFINLLGLS